MSHIPYGYEISDGKIFIAEKDADKVRLIFQNYVSGMSLTESAKSAGHPITHSMVKRLLQRKCYLGDGFYPQIVDVELFGNVNAEINRRAEQQHNTDRKRRKKPVIHTDFMMSDEHEPQENFTKQAEFLYSLIGVK